MYKDDTLSRHICGHFRCRFVPEQLGDTQEGGTVTFASLRPKTKQEKEHESRSGEQPTRELHGESIVRIAHPYDGGDLTDIRKVVMRVSPRYPRLDLDAFVRDVDAVYADRNCEQHF